MAKKKVFQISNALAEGLEETVNAAHNYNGELRIEVVPLKKIELDPDNPRELFISLEDIHEELDEDDKDYERKLHEKQNLESIAHSIKTQGLINPVVVYKYGEKYRLIAGERRTLASLMAGKNDIQAKVLDSKPSELKISLLQWIENIERKDLSLWERVKNLEKIVLAHANLKGVSQQDLNPTELSRLIGCSLPHAMNYKSVLVANNKIKELIKQNKIRNLEKAALIASIKTHELQQAAITACLAGATLKKLKSLSLQDKVTKQLRPHLSPQQNTSRGRQASLFNFGSTKNKSVAKVVIESILQHEKLTHLQKHFTDLNWSDCRSISHSFKQLLQTLEKIATESL